MLTIRSNPKEKQKAQALLKKIKEITKKPNIYNLLDALELLKEKK